MERLEYQCCPINSVTSDVECPRPAKADVQKSRCTMKCYGKKLASDQEGGRYPSQDEARDDHASRTVTETNLQSTSNMLLLSLGKKTPKATCAACDVLPASGLWCM